MCAAFVGDVSRTLGTGASTSAFTLVKDGMRAPRATVASPISAAYEHTTGFTPERSATRVCCAENRFTTPVPCVATSAYIQANGRSRAHTAQNSSPTPAICRDTNDHIAARNRSRATNVASASQTARASSTTRRFMLDAVLTVLAVAVQKH